MSFSSKTIEVVSIKDDGSTTVDVRCEMELEGSPQAQARPRRGNGGVFYNPICRAMCAFKAKIKDGIPVAPIFGSNKPVAVRIKFFMRRPNAHFKGDDRFKKLKTGLPLAHTTNPDLDNLVKFALDGMNKLVYQDDKQVVKLTVLKLYDSEGGCEGRTTIQVTEFDDRTDID